MFLQDDKEAAHLQERRNLMWLTLNYHTKISDGQMKNEKYIYKVEMS